MYWYVLTNIDIFPTAVIVIQTNKELIVKEKYFQFLDFFLFLCLSKKIYIFCLFYTYV